MLAVFGVEVRSHVIQLGGIPDTPLELTWDQIAAIDDDAPLHCADNDAQQRMIDLIDETRKKATLLAAFEVVARRVVPGLGSHTSWDLKLDGLLAQAVMSIPAVKAVAIGVGQKPAVCRVLKYTMRSPTTLKTASLFAERTAPAVWKAASLTANRSECAAI